VRDDDNIDYRAVTLAVLVSLGLHLGLLWLIPPSFQQKFSRYQQPVEVMTTPIKVEEARLPPSMRFAQANSAANQAVPKQTPFFAAQNQTAAQPVPEKSPTKSPLPKSDGKSKQIVVAKALPRVNDEVLQPPAPALPPTVAMAPKTAGSAVGPKEGVDTKAKPTPDEPPIPANPNRPRAMVPSGLSGMLLKNPVGVGRVGAISIDCRFSNYGDYTQRMLEAIQTAWWSTIRRSRFESIEGGSALVRFRLHRDGTVTDAAILRSNVPRIMALACKDAVMAPAPYDIWRADMVAQFGESDIVTINFLYYHE
jgi:hypothetical protein